MLNEIEKKIMVIVTELFKVPPAVMAAQKLHEAGIISDQVNNFKGMADPYRVAIVNAMQDIEKKIVKEKKTNG